MDVSVIIPVYNVEHYLKQCLNSLLRQTLENIEIICVDDGSTDSSLNILNDYKNKYSNINVISQKNCGSSVARNRGLKVAKGKYIYFLDSDDYLDDNALELCVKEAEENNLDIVLFDARVIYEDGAEDYGYIFGDEISRANVLGKDIISGEDAFNLMVENKSPAHTTWLQLFRHDFLTKNNLIFYEGIVHQDAIHSVVSDIKAQRVRHIGKILHTYRIRKNSVTTSAKSYRNIKGNYTVATELYEFYRKYAFDNCKNRTSENLLYYSRKFYKDAIHGCDLLNELKERQLINEKIPKEIIDIDLMMQIESPNLYYKKI